MWSKKSIFLFQRWKHNTTETLERVQWLVALLYLLYFTDIIWILDQIYINSYTWWRHQMETFYALLAFCAGNSPVTGEFPSQRPVTRSFDVFFHLRLKNDWVNSRDPGDFWCHSAHYDVIVMNFNNIFWKCVLELTHGNPLVSYYELNKHLIET